MSQYKTVKKRHGPLEFREKGSRFISFIHPVEKKPEVEEILGSLRKEYHDATHVCYAYRLKTNHQEDIRYSDDGEPPGTAGLPIFNELKFAGYLNVLLAVVRYFGGVKLGTGGLARAYGRAAREVLSAAIPEIKYQTSEIKLVVPFDLTGKIMKLFEKYQAEVLSRRYTSQGAELRVSIRKDSISSLQQDLKNLSSGRIFFH